MHLLRRAALAALLLSVTTTTFAAAVDRSLELGSRGSAQLRLPDSWRYTVDRGPDDSTPPTLRFSPSSGAPFQVLITVFTRTPTATADFGSDANLRKLAQGGADAAQSSAVEKKLDLKPLGGASGSNGGYYFQATDKAPKAGEFKFITQGTVRIGDLVGTFTILTNDGQKDVIDSALDALRGARLAKSAVLPVFNALGRVHLPVPGQNWELSFAQEDWTLANSRQRTDGRGYYVHYSSAGQGLNVSFYVDLAERCKTGAECRELFWSNPGPGYAGAKDVKRFDLNGFSVLQSTVPLPDAGLRSQQVNYSAHLVRNGYWIDVHMSKLGTFPVDAAPLEKFLKALTVGASGT